MEEDLSQDEKNKNKKCSLCGDIIKGREFIQIIKNGKFICMDCYKNLSGKEKSETRHILDMSDVETAEEFNEISDPFFIKWVSEAIEKNDKCTLYVQEIYNVIDTHKENAVSILTSEQIKYGNNILSELHLADSPIEINTSEGIRIFKDCYEKYRYKMVEILKELI